MPDVLYKNSKKKNVILLEYTDTIICSLSFFYFVSSTNKKSVTHAPISYKTEACLIEKPETSQWYRLRNL